MTIDLLEYPNNGLDALADLRNLTKSATDQIEGQVQNAPGTHGIAITANTK